MSQHAIIIGAGPAGLTAAYELLKRTEIIPVILEKSGEIGGISKTIRYKGNRMDIGGHRFFSKSDRVMDWWLQILPLEKGSEKEFTLTYRRRHRTVSQPDLSRETADTCACTNRDSTDKVLLIRKRLSRIYFLRRFFDYPIRLSLDTLKKLGFVRTCSILASYAKARLFPRKPERNLEDFFINRFGVQLYRLFFKDYTEKVWGMPCTKIAAEWGAQRIRGISVAKALAHALKTLSSLHAPKQRSGRGREGLAQKDTETSLIEQFLYPKFGPGQLWEEVARQVEEMGGLIKLHQEVSAIQLQGHSPKEQRYENEPVRKTIQSIEAFDPRTGETSLYEGDYFFSTMPVQELMAGMGDAVPGNVKEIAAGLEYRDFITVGILLRKMSFPEAGVTHGQESPKILQDTWIYIQEKDVKVGRLQLFNNWSPSLVADPDTVWLGMEYFCRQGDAFWNLSDHEIETIAILELEKMGLAAVSDVLDTHVRRVEKTYPAYFGTYDRFDEIRVFTDGIENLFLVGRNGMHKYNNADHSMLTAMVAVDNIAAGIRDKANIWAINTEQEYQEEKASPASSPAGTFAATPEFVFGFVAGKLKKRWTGWLLVLLAGLVQFILFKFRYPYANYMPDSYSYLEAAFSNADVNTWPVAYSKFLRLVSVFTHSDNILTGLQYFFLLGSGWVFLSCLLEELQPGKWVRVLLQAFFLLNPLLLCIANYISADALFIGLSLLWLSSILCILFRPRPYWILVQAILLLATFTVRYNALYYPLVAALAYSLSRLDWKFKAAGIALGLLLVLASVGYTRHKMFELTGESQFSPFGGWQLANNALYMYQNIPASQRERVPARFEKLETLVREHMDTLKRVKLTQADTVSAHFYLWSAKGPLVQYMLRAWKKDSTTSNFKRWASEAPLYGAYGAYLIRKYPLPFVRSFLWPNARKYAVPPIEFIGLYNMGSDSVGRLAKEWFHYSSLKISHREKGVWNPFMQTYPICVALTNTALVGCFMGFLFLGGLKKAEPVFTRFIFLMLALWVLNAGFSVFASPVVLRYQVFPMLVGFSCCLILLEKLYKMESSCAR